MWQTQNAWIGIGNGLERIRARIDGSSQPALGIPILKVYPLVLYMRLQNHRQMRRSATSIRGNCLGRQSLGMNRMFRTMCDHGLALKSVLVPARTTRPLFPVAPMQIPPFRRPRIFPRLGGLCWSSTVVTYITLVVTNPPSILASSLAKTLTSGSPTSRVSDR